MSRTRVTELPKFKNLNSLLSNKQDLIWHGIAETDADLNDLKQIGTISVHGTCTNMPPDTLSDSWGLLTVSANTEDGGIACTQRLSIMVVESWEPILYERNWNSINWSKWARIATATPPQIFNLPLVDGFSNLENVTSAYWKNQFGEATVILQAEKEQLINDGEIAAYLPAGFRPSAPQRFLCLGPTLRRPGFLYVDPDGSIKISFSGNAPSTDVLASFTFVAAT